MSNKYKRLNDSTVEDFADLFEPAFSTNDSTYTADWCAQFTGEAAFNKASTNTSGKLTLDQFKVNGTSITGVKRGYLPTKQFKFAEFTTAGTYYMIRTDAGFTFKDANKKVISTITASQFRGGKTPWRILVIGAGGGGGGGGRGYYKYAKNDYRPNPGGSGGGGYIDAGAWVIDDNVEYKLTVGAGGSAGSNGSSGTESSGTAGGKGGATGIYCASGNYHWIGAAGGGGGGAGGSTSGANGAAGTPGDDVGVDTVPYCVGGGGNCFNDMDNTGVSAVSYTPTQDTGIGALSLWTARSNNGQTENKSVQDGDSFFSGGCSLGYGDYFSGATTCNSGSNGGGGASGPSHVRAGHAGSLAFYY